jgi:hypothetical protein
MRMIVEAFKETLELGLTKPKQIVVRIYLSRRFLAVGFFWRPTDSKTTPVFRVAGMLDLWHAE